MNQPPKRFTKFIEDNPEIGKAYNDLGEALTNAGPLNEKQIALVKVGISTGARMEGALRSHVRKALQAGASPAEIKHAVLLSTTTIGFPNMMAALSWLDDLLEAEHDS
ncbi:MAG: carboxymuconolactone decarboxylase family protein [Armatimonadetes bacterium]|nr:carboxymuconolactone decarboxylase family protein [Armatimonadota bacterium]